MLASERGRYDLILCRPALHASTATPSWPARWRASSPATACSCSRLPAARRARARGAHDTYLAQVRLREAYAVRAVITAICPGSYDPVTNGHVDVIARAAQIFDRVVVGVVGTPQHKTTLFPIDERVELVRDALAHVETSRSTCSRSSSSTTRAAGRRG